MVKETDLGAFERIIHYHFTDRQRLQEALTHRSYVNERETARDNERLEFLGDAILDFLVADMLFRRFPDEDEGELTDLRASLVKAEALAQLAQAVRLGEFLIIGKGEEKTDGRTRTNILCRGFEAVVGAIYMDGGLDATKAFVIPHLEGLLDHVLANALHKDARSILQERSQAELHITPRYRIVNENGPEHGREFVVEVVIGEVVLARATGTSKKGASQAAARLAVEQLEREGWSTQALAQKRIKD